MVAGFGAAGSVAAIEAHDSGSRVLILEAMPEGGGACRVSGGWIYGCVTSIQRIARTVDSSNDTAKYNMAIDDLADPELCCVWGKDCGKLVN